MSDYIEYQTVEGTLWNNMTGWDLIKVTEKRYVQSHSHYDSNKGCNVQVYAPQSERIPVFVFGRKRDQVIEDLQNTISKQCNEIHDLKIKFKGVEEALKIETDKLTKLTEKHERVDARWGACIEELKKSEDKKRLMEQDIAKIRNALGEIRMNEILGVK